MFHNRVGCCTVEMTYNEVRELRRDVAAMKWSDIARARFDTFMSARGWDTPEQQEAAIAYANERWANRSRHAKMLDSYAYCEICGKRAGGVSTWYGHRRCKAHWEYPPAYGGSADGLTPLYDWVTGFPLSSRESDLVPADVADAAGDPAR